MTVGRLRNVMKTRKIRRHQKAARSHLRALERRIRTARGFMLRGGGSFGAIVDDALDRYLPILDLVRCWDLEIDLREGVTNEPAGYDS